MPINDDDLFNAGYGVRQQGSQLRAAVAQTYGQNPDTIAMHNRTADFLGIPRYAAQTLPEDAQREATMRRIEQTTAGTPVSRGLLSQPEVAQVAHDDADNMSLIELLATGFEKGSYALHQMYRNFERDRSGRMVRAFASVDKQLAEGKDLNSLLGEGTEFWNATGLSNVPYRDDPVKQRQWWDAYRDANVPKVQAEFERQISEGADMQRRSAAVKSPAVLGRMNLATSREPGEEISFRENPVGALKDMWLQTREWMRAAGTDPVGAIVQPGMQSLVTTLPQLAAAGVAPQAAIPIMFAGSATQDYTLTTDEALRRRGVNTQDPKAVAAAMSDPKIAAEVQSEASRHAMMVGAFDAAGAKLITGKILPKGVAAKLPNEYARELADIPLQVAAQGATGAAGELTGQIAAGQPLDLNAVYSEALGEMFGTPGEMVGMHTRVLQERMIGAHNARQAEAVKQHLESLDAAVAQSKLRARDEQVFAQFAQSLNAEGAPAYYIDAKKLIERGGDTLTKSIPGLEEQLAVADTTGGAVQISASDFMQHVMGTPLFQQLVDDVKIEPDGFTFAESKEHKAAFAQELQAEIERTSLLVDQATEKEAGRAAVQADFKKMLDDAGRYSSDVNDKIATLYSHYAATVGQAAGMTPQELHEKFGPRIEYVRKDQQRAGIAGVVSKLKQAVGIQPEMTPATNQGILDTAAQGPLSKEEADYFRSLGISAESIPTAAVEDIRSRYGWTQTSVSETGLPIWEGEKVSLRSPRDVTRDVDVFYKAPEGRTAVKYDIHAPGVAEPVGYVALEMDGDWPTRVLDLEVANAYRGKGYAEDTITSLLSDVGQLDIWTIVPDAQSWWSRIGAESYASASTTDGSISLESNAVARAGRAVQDQDVGTLRQASPLTPARGAILIGKSPESFRPVIQLFEEANYSTILHELGHYFLEMHTFLASQENAPANIQKDVAAAMNWLGTTPEAWAGMSMDEREPLHEKFARGFETYLFEGKAPNTALDRLFARLSEWLRRIYQTVTKLDAQLTPEVRRVFDAMLASEQDIQTAEAVRNMRPLFDTAVAAGMEPSAFAEYLATNQDATNEAVAQHSARALRDAAFIGNARGRETKRLQRAAAEIRKGIRREVAEQVMAEPVNQARQFLKRGVMMRDGEQIEVTQGNKLNIEALKEMYPDAALELQPDWRSLGYGKFGMLSKDGLHPDVVAPIFGYDSGDAMVLDLLDAEDARAKIEALTDQRMLEEHGELSSQEAIAESAEKAIHNDVRLRVLATEHNALASLIGGRKIVTSAARQLAQATIERLKIRTITPSQYRAAESRAAKASEKSFRAGDSQQAALEKRNQIFNAMAAREADLALDRVDSGVRFVRDKLLKESARKGIDIGYLDQIDAILERFSFSPLSNKRAAKQESLQAWVASMEESGKVPELSPEVLNEAYSDHYKNLTVEQFDNLIDDLKQLAHLGRFKDRLLKDKEKRRISEVSGALSENIDKIAEEKGRTSTDIEQAATSGELRKSKLRKFGADHIKMSSTVFVMDGGVDGGPMAEAILYGANDAADFETTHNANVTEHLNYLLADIRKRHGGSLSSKRKMRPEVGKSLTDEQILGVALNVGNLGNLQRLRDGNGWSEAQIVALLENHMDPADWKAVQGIWNLFGEYAPLIQAKERRVYGRSLKMVESGSGIVEHFAEKLGIDLPGGYYPVKYDPAASTLADEREAANEAKRQMQGAYTSATTRNSFRKERAAKVSGQPLALTLDAMYSGFQDVIHDLAWHEWLIDTNAILRSTKLRETIRQRYGITTWRSIKQWVELNANGGRTAAASSEQWAAVMRRNVSLAGLGFNLWNAIQQPIGFTQSIRRIGWNAAMDGVGTFLSNPKQATIDAQEKSPFMADRVRTMNRELNEVRNLISGHEFRQKYHAFAYLLAARTQQVVDVPTWHGAYSAALAQPGMTEEKAIHIADQAVRDSQGSGHGHDLAAVMRNSSETVKLFTTFMHFMNTTMNMAYMYGKTSKGAADTINTALLLFVIPVVLQAALKDAITPGDREEDWDKYLRRLAGEGFSYMIGGVIGVRELGELGKSVAAGEPIRDYQGPAGARVLVDLGKAGNALAKEEYDTNTLRALINLLGSTTGAPSAQINRLVSGAGALSSGETDNPGALLMGVQRPQ